MPEGSGDVRPSQISARSGAVRCPFVGTTAINPGLVASSILRAQQTSNSGGWQRTAGLLRRAALAVSGLDFVPVAGGGSGLLMHHPQGIVIGGGAVVFTLAEPFAKRDSG